MIARLRAASAEDRLLLIGLPLLVAALLTPRPPSLMVLKPACTRICYLH